LPLFIPPEFSIQATKAHIVVADFWRVALCAKQPSPDAADHFNISFAALAVTPYD